MRYRGLPEIIRCDLGLPFASSGLGRLSSMSLRWIEQGIAVEFMRPASPQENGSHERMHRDLKAEASHPPPRPISPRNSAASSAGVTPIITTGRTRRSTSKRRRIFTRPAPGAPARATNRWSIPETRRSKSSPAPATSRTKAATITSATPSPANASACGSTLRGAPNCTLPTCTSVISPSTPREADSNPPPTSPRCACHQPIKTGRLRRRGGSKLPPPRPSLEVFSAQASNLSL